MVLQYGMSEILGPQTYEQGHPSLFLDPMMPRPRLEVSEETCRDIDREVHTLIAESHERAHKVLEARRPTLDKLAHLLLERETVEGGELRAMMQATH
jgi:cell division protease FtsH